MRKIIYVMHVFYAMYFYGITSKPGFAQQVTFMNSEPMHAVSKDDITLHAPAEK